MPTYFLHSPVTSTPSCPHIFFTLLLLRPPQAHIFSSLSCYFDPLMPTYRHTSTQVKYGNSQEHYRSHSTAGPFVASRDVQLKDRVRFWRRTAPSFCLSPVFPPSFTHRGDAGTETQPAYPSDRMAQTQPVSSSDRMAQRLSLSLPVTEWHKDSARLSQWQDGTDSACLSQWQNGTDSACLSQWQKGTDSACLSQWQKGTDSACLSQWQKGTDSACLSQWQKHSRRAAIPAASDEVCQSVHSPTLGGKIREQGKESSWTFYETNCLTISVLIYVWQL